MTVAALPAAAGATAGGATAGTAAGGTAASGATARGTAAATAGGTAGGTLGGKGKSKPKSKGRPKAQRALIAEFLLCLLVLALSPLARGKNAVAPGDWMRKGSALCGVYLLLGLLSAVGPRTAKAAIAFGGLVAVVLVIDQRSVFTAIAKAVNRRSDPATDSEGIDTGPGLGPDGSTLGLTPGPGLGPSGTVLGSRPGAGLGAGLGPDGSVLGRPGINRGFVGP